MSIMKKSVFAALALGMVSVSAQADELIGTFGAKKGGIQSIALDLATSGESVAFEFVVALPKGASKVDVSGCLANLPATHSGRCVFNEKSNEIIAIAFSAENAKLPAGVMDLGSVNFALRNSSETAKIQGLVVADRLGGAIASKVQTDNALLNNATSEKTK